MNNKGFTLVELIITLSLIILMGLVITANMSGMFSKEEDKSVEKFKKQLEDAACVLVEDSSYHSRCTSGCTISMNDLIINGLIDEDLKDPRNNIKVKDSTYKVTVEWNNHVKSCVFKE